MTPRESPWAPLIRAADLPHEHTHLPPHTGGTSHGGGKAQRPLKIQPRLLSASRDRHLASRNKATPGTSRRGRTAPVVSWVLRQLVQGGWIMKRAHAGAGKAIL